MVREHVGEVFRALARLLLDPRRGQLVTRRAGSARDLPVADVPHEHVPEPVLLLALHRAGACGTDELLARKFVQRQLDLTSVAAAHRRDGARPEHLAEHRGILEQALPFRRQRVEAGGDQCLHRFGYLHAVGKPTMVCEQPHELLRVERVSARLL